jgi:hypothetical protein
VVNSAVRVLLADDPKVEEERLEAEVGPAISAQPDDLPPNPPKD